MISQERPIPFSKALSESKEKNQNGGRHLLLGNGFSIEYSETFHYRNLFKQGVSRAEHKSVLALAELYEEYDFERLIKLLTYGQDVLHCLKKEYKKENGQAQQMLQLLDTLDSKIDEIIDYLRDIFLQALVKTHPEKPEKLRPINPQNVIDFLSHFETLYTVNYDLLLYWFIIEYIKSPANKNKEFRDGFSGDKSGRMLIWRYPDKTNVWYLHGALHLFERSRPYELIKIRSKKDCQSNWQSLLEQIKNRIRQKQFPVIVCEGSWTKKLEKIMHHFYLWEGYHSLKRLRGDLFTFGMSFREDDHILKAIAESEISTVYVGIYKPGREDSDFPDIRCKVEKLLKTKEVKFYSTETVNL
jgi:hypothetical protein